MRRRQSFGIRGGEIDDQADNRLFREVAAANTEPANFDQAGQFTRRPHNELPSAWLKMDAVVADQHGLGYLPRAPGKDEIEGETRFAGP